MEVWKDIINYEGLYEVSNYGSVRGVDRYSSTGHFVRGTILKLREDKDGYYRVNLSKNSKKSHFRINRLVADAFLENPNNYPVVNHKDGNKKNNHVENLEWCTRSENDLHAFKLGLRVATDGGMSKPINKIDPATGNIINTYKSISEAARLNNCNNIQNISYCVNGKNKLAYGYKWAFVNEGVTTIQNGVG